METTTSIASKVVSATQKTIATTLNAQLSVSLIPLTMFFGILSVIGVIGNAIVLVVFVISKEYHGSNFRVFVVSFGFVDLITCLLFLPMEFIKNHVHAFYDSQITCKLKCFLNICGMVYAALLLLLISVERYRKVCHPLRPQMWPSLAAKLVGVVITLTFFLSLPAPFMCGIEQISRKSQFNATIVHNEVLLVCKSDEKFLHSKLRIIYKLFLVICLIVISVSVIIMYILIGRVIRRQTGFRRTNSGLRGASRYETTYVKEEAQKDDLDENKGKTQPDGTKEDLLNHCVSPEIENTQKNGKARMDYKTGSLRKQVMLKNVCLKNGSLDAKGERRRRLSSYSGPNGFPYKTIIWLVLTVIFLVTYAIYAGMSFIEPSSSPNRYVLYNFLLRLYFINSVANPVVYALLDKRFRRSCKRLVMAFKDKLMCHCCETR